MLGFVSAWTQLLHKQQSPSTCTKNKIRRSFCIASHGTGERKGNGTKGGRKGIGRPRGAVNCRPHGYWKDEKNVIHEVYVYLSKRNSNSEKNERNSKKSKLTTIPSALTANSNNSRVMPTPTELANARRSDLAGAIRRHGWANIAKKGGLILSSHARPRSLNLSLCTELKHGRRMRAHGYWSDFEHLRKEAIDFIGRTDGIHDKGRLPSRITLCKHGRSDLCRAVSMHGGFVRVAHMLGLKCASEGKTAKAVDTDVDEDVLKCIDIINGIDSNRVKDRMIKRGELQRIGRPDLIHQLSKLGFRKLGKKLRLRTKT